MMLRKSMIFCALGTALLLSACQFTTSTNPPPVSDTLSEPLVECQAPRPQMCTRQYDPVCGIAADGVRKTQGNACSACSDAAIVAYVSGECDSAH